MTQNNFKQYLSRELGIDEKTIGISSLGRQKIDNPFSDESIKTNIYIIKTLSGLYGFGYDQPNMGYFISKYIMDLPNELKPLIINGIKGNFMFISINEMGFLKDYTMKKRDFQFIFDSNKNIIKDSIKVQRSQIYQDNQFIQFTCKLKNEDTVSNGARIGDDVITIESNNPLYPLPPICLLMGAFAG